MLGINYFND